MFDYSLSVLLAFVVRAEKGRCWLNAARVAANFPELLEGGGSYIEGWIVLHRSPEEPVEHGWCQFSDGTIVDPSIVLLINEGDLVSYFPGLCLNSAQVRALDGTMMPHVRHAGTYGTDGFGHDGFRRAHDAAWAASRRLQKNHQTCHTPPRRRGNKQGETA
jgi:hypothetical protein